MYGCESWTVKKAECQIYASFLTLLKIISKKISILSRITCLTCLIMDTKTFQMIQDLPSPYDDPYVSYTSRGSTRITVG